MTRPMIALVFLLLGHLALGADNYQFGPDFQPHDGVPKGTITNSTWTSKVVDGTVRDHWVYVPAQYDGKSPAG